SLHDALPILGITRCPGHFQRLRCLPRRRGPWHRSSPSPRRFLADSGQIPTEPKWRGTHPTLVSRAEQTEESPLPACPDRNGQGADRNTGGRAACPGISPAVSVTVVGCREQDR